MDLQVTPSQRRAHQAHQARLDLFWPQRHEVAPAKRAVKPAPTPARAITAADWFAEAWSMLDGPLIRPSIREIQDMVCERFGVPLLYMETSRRSHAYYVPRAAAMYLCKKFTGQSHPTIARMFGNRDHSSITYCVRAVEKMIALNHPIAKDIEILSAKLGANQ